MLELLEFEVDPFGAVVVLSDRLPSDPGEFSRRLDKSLKAWTEQGNKAVWLEVPIARSSLIPVAVEAGFGFHHSGQDYLLMTQRLVEDAILPPFATHYIGIGGVVLTPERELLVVREKYGMRGRAPSLKLPGGALQAGEHLVDAVEREVLEETGIKAVFEAMACFRQWHGYRYGKSDIYFVGRLRPLTKEIIMQDDEIQECLWLPVDEFLEREDIAIFNKQIVRAALETEGVVQSFIEGFGDPDTREYFMPPHLVDGITVVPFQGQHT
ncbi:MAG: 8-oxo-dGTP pyrophosphatase MutT, NUDIX family [Chloroflexi bacterium]|jgi:8-oxo-dGTP pyrophosphatase MutT (NUDIX family)|nr:MAG: 8-oxo-dGTP pyrophosphatase MutT, NUDIX family [Chloroflexota bacterium]